MKSIPRDATGISILNIRSRIQAPAALNSRLLLPSRRAIATMRSTRDRRSCSKA
jgi:hypothetical protein